MPFDIFARILDLRLNLRNILWMPFGIPGRFLIALRKDDAIECVKLTQFSETFHTFPTSQIMYT